METIETPYFDESVELKKITPLQVEIAVWKIRAWQKFAHHPTCSRYRAHYFTIGKINLCVGCTSFFSNWIILLIIYAFLKNFFINNAILLVILYFLGIFAAIIHLIIKPNKKWLKTILRSLLGLTLGSYTILIINAPNIWYKIILGGLTVPAVYFYNILRGRNKNLELCINCPMKLHDPPCDPVKNTDIKIRKINEMVLQRISYINNLKAEYLANKSNHNKQDIDDQINQNNLKN